MAGGYSTPAAARPADSSSEARLRSAAQVTLRLSADPGTATTVTTGPDGSFTGTVTAQSGNYWATNQGTSTTAPWSSGIITITVTPLPVTMHAALTVPHATYGQADQVGRICWLL